MNASAVYHDPQTVEIFAPFDRYFIEQLKYAIPVGCRQWDAGSKSWLIGYGFAGIAVDLVRRFWPNAIIESPPSPLRPPTPAQIDPDRAALFLLPNAPFEVVKAAYRALAKTNHPDRVGGDGSNMRKINDAFARIEQRCIAEKRVA